MGKSKTFKPDDQVFLIKDYQAFSETGPTQGLRAVLILKALTKGTVVNHPEIDGTNGYWLVRFRISDTMDMLVNLFEQNLRHIPEPEWPAFNAEKKVDDVDMCGGPV